MSATTTCDRCNTTVPSRKARAAWIQVSRRRPDANPDDLFGSQTWDACSPSCANAIIVEKIEPAFAKYIGD